MAESIAECSIKQQSPTSIEHGHPQRTTAQHQQLPPRPKLEPLYPSAEVRTAPRCSSSSTHHQSQDDEEELPFYLSGLANASAQCRGFDEQGTAASEKNEDEQGQGEWVSVITAPAYAPMPSWLTVMRSLIRHPERNSSNILRADILQETQGSAESRQQQPPPRAWSKQWTIRRALLPRRPNLDWRMEQECCLYYRYASPRQRSSNGVAASEEEQAEEEAAAAEIEEAVVVYTPLIGALQHPKMALPAGEAVGEMGQPPPSEGYVPFYHPKVRALAFHFRTSPPSRSSTSADTVYGQLGISLVPFVQTKNAAFPPAHRLSRVGLSLLTTLHMHTWGELHSYRKRVHHDQVVPRTLYQDLYLSLKAKYASELIKGWAEATDPTKHVFEEMGIAAFLIALWRLLYKKDGKPREAAEDGEQDEERWKERVKFVDVGCGNGLLSYILAREGFKGVGLDLRSRKSWVQYRACATLNEWTFEPHSLLDATSDPENERIWRGAFLVGNHADELTPWIPVLAYHYKCAGLINLPCCYYALDGRRDFPLLLKGAAAAGSRNEQYLAYLSQLHAHFGWKVQLEPLRIPSTKNWCFVATHQTHTDLEDVLQKRVAIAVQTALQARWAPRSSTSKSN